jgi:hypothetical protein
MMIKTSFVEMMKQFVQAFDSTKKDGFNLFNEVDLKTKASNYGEGVKYVSGDKVLADGYEGFKAIYSFTDINKIKINPSPEDKVPLGDDLEEAPGKKNEEILEFDFKKGNPSVLVINLPQSSKDEEPKVEEEVQKTQEANDSILNSTEMQKLVEMFEGMKISLVLNFNDKIDETDASFVDGSEVTLINLDFAEIIKHKDILEELQKDKPESMEKMREIVGKLPGVKFEFKDKVTIKF